MGILYTGAWLERTDISSISVTTFIIITPLSKYFPPEYQWYVTHNISDTAVRELRSVKRGQVLVPELGWQYFDSDYDQSSFTDCKTVR